LHLGDVTLAGQIIREALPVACANCYLWLEVWLRRAFAVVIATAAPAVALQGIATARVQASALGMLPDVAICDCSPTQVLASAGRTVDAAARREAVIQAFDRLGMPPPLPSPILQLT